MGNSSSKPTQPKQTIDEATSSLKRQINYRPAEADRLSRELSCLQKAKTNGFKVVVTDKSKACAGEGSPHCAMHMYKK